MTEPKLKRIDILVRVIFIALCAAIFATAAQAVQSALTPIRERAQYDSRLPAYVGTATGIAAAQSAVTDEVTPTPVAAKPLQNILLRQGLTLHEQDFITNTPQPTFPDVGTNTPVPTQASPATDTPAIPSTPRPLPTLFTYADASANTNAGTAIPAPVGAVDRRGYDLMNILLLGNDGEITEDGSLRTDTMIVLSINRTTGTVAMLSLPRDLYVYIPGWTMQRLNVAYIHGEAVGWTDGGFGLMRQTLFYNFGINVHYYAMVDLEGFKALVDAVGGINLAVDCAIQDLPLVASEVPSAAVRVTEDGEYALPVGYYQMSGAEALWYARSRSSSSDFDRGRRQQQVLRAVWRQARENGLIGSAPQLWNEGIEYVETNLTFEDMLSVLPIAASLDSTGIENFWLARGYHTTPWQPPDGINVQLPNPDAIRELMIDFYSPATESQITGESASVRVYNGTTLENLDRVASERLAWERMNASAAGAADNTAYTDTIVIDYTGRSKGSSLGEIVRTLNIRPENIRAEPNPNREVDFDVILGSTYNSCIEQGVLPVEITPWIAP